MNFESLSNELILDIFDFLDDIHILHAFHNLNYRYNDLLLTYFRVSSQLNLQSITKFDFDTTCKYLTPFVADKIHSLHLSNDDDTPQQIDLFLSYGLTLYNFPHLKSLSLNYMHSEQTINRMMLEWQYPIHLTHLNITQCQVLNDWNIVYSLINNIWSLPKLTHCQLDINVIDEKYSIVPTVTSSAIEYLSIKNIHCNFEALINLFEHTPRLRYLDITINGQSTNPYLPFSVPLLTTLKLSYEGQLSVLRSLLQNVPNLRNLTMRTKNIHIDTHQWEEIISNHLSKLKVFHLLMEYNPEYTYYYWLSKLITPYKSDFWLKERHWYIQGHSYKQGDEETIFLHTLPYTFDDYYIPSNDGYLRSESYSSKFSDQMLYDHVHRLFCVSLPKDSYTFHNRFFHIRHLVLKLPIDNTFWTCIPTFNQLRTLDISLFYTEAYNEDALFQLQTLLERAPKLYSLTFKSSIITLLPLLECTSESIVKLDFQNCAEYFNRSECATLFLSSLGKQCQILSIKVDDPMYIPQLIEEMPQLHTLNVECLPNKYKINVSLSLNDELIEWLQPQLLSTCTITRDSAHLNKIQIWMH